MSSGKGEKSQYGDAATEGADSLRPEIPAEDRTLAQDPAGAGPTASDAEQPAETEIPAAPPSTDDPALPPSAFELPTESGTVGQGDFDAAKSLELSIDSLYRTPGYRRIEKLGAGTYGEVWLAKQDDTDIDVAVKFITHGADERWKFLQDEVKQLAKLHADPGIVQLIDVEIDSVPPYFIMAYAPNGSLAKRLEQGPLPVEEAVQIFRQVAEALAYVHARGICHCDLKPGNVLLDARNRALVADFGQAHLTGDPTAALGTYFYMAPEQAALESSLPDPRWDVYGLGALAYAMLTGQPPREDTALRTRLKSTDQLFERLRLYRESIRRAPNLVGHRQAKGVDRDLANIIDRCLALDPQARPRDAAAVLEALARRERKRRQRPALLFGLVAPVLLLLVMAIFVGSLFVTAKEEASSAQQKMNAKISDRNQFIAELVADDIEDRLESYIILVKESANEPSALRALKNNDQAAATTLVQDCRKRAAADKKPELVWIANQNGKILKIDPHSDFKETFQWRDWFNGKGDMEKNAHAEPIEKPYISQPYLSTATGRPMLIAITTPIRDPADGDRVVGVMGVAIKLETLERWVSRLDVDRQFAVVLNERGQYLSHQAKEKIKPEDDKEPLKVPPTFAYHPDALPKGKAGIIREAFTDPIDGKTYVASYAALPRNKEFRWVVAIQREHRALSQSMEDMNRSMLWIGLTAVAVLGILIPALWGWLIWMLRHGEDVAHA